MATEVSLRAVVDEMDLPNAEWAAYLNSVTGELFTATEEDQSALDLGDDSELVPEWQREALSKLREIEDSDDWLELPSSYEIHEYEIIERFCDAVEDTRHREVLFVAISGSGAFRRFKDAIHRFGIHDEWYSYRERAFAEIAVEWLEINGIPYKKDL
jgi:hypothetical protein